MTDRATQDDSRAASSRSAAGGRPPHVSILVGLISGAAGGILANALWSGAPQLRWAVDRLLDMARTVPNVTGDLLTSLVVARSERLAVAPDPEPGPSLAPDPPTRPTTAGTLLNKS